MTRHGDRLTWRLQILCPFGHRAGAVRLEMEKLQPFEFGERVEEAADGTPRKLRVICGECRKVPGRGGPAAISWARIQAAMADMKAKDQPRASLRVDDPGTVLYYRKHN